MTSFAVYMFLALSMIITGCKNLLVNEPVSNNAQADFEATWNEVNRVYPFFQFKHINWDSVHTFYEPLIEQAKGDEGFTLLSNMLAGLKDSHVYITTHGGEETYPYIPPRTVRDNFTFDPNVTRKYFNKGLSLTGEDKIEFGILPDSIGYIRLTTFTQGDWIDDFDNVLDYMHNTKALIIDVRNNPGGYGSQASFVVGRFISVAIPYIPEYFKNELINNTSVQPRGPFTYTNPVVVLINGVSASASEHFTEMMKQDPKVIVVGDTTAGAGGNGGDIFSLPSGRRVQVSTRDFRRYDGIPIEWNGIDPDIVVIQTRADLKNGQDLQLERAINLLR